jgi:hypothetical protein
VPCAAFRGSDRAPERFSPPPRKPEAEYSRRYEPAAFTAPSQYSKDHYWNCPGTELAGNTIDFLMRIRGATFHEAMQQLTQPRRS